MTWIGPAAWTVIALPVPWSSTPVAVPAAALTVSPFDSVNVCEVPPAIVIPVAPAADEVTETLSPNVAPSAPLPPQHRAARRAGAADRQRRAAARGQHRDGHVGAAVTRMPEAVAPACDVQARAAERDGVRAGDTGQGDAGRAGRARDRQVRAISGRSEAGGRDIHRSACAAGDGDARAGAAGGVDGDRHPGQADADISRRARDRGAGQVARAVTVVVVVPAAVCASLIAISVPPTSRKP
ncbi:MAG: hypothetical protein WDN24_06350 [Sphingomonas sp.]